MAKLKDYVTGALLVCLVFLGLILFALYDKSAPNEHQKPDYNFSSDCDISADDCRLHLFNDLELRLQVSPSEIKALERFQLKLHTMNNAGAELSNLVAWVEGRDMDMGQHFLSSKAELANEFVLSGMIPICTVDAEMVWRLVVNFEFQGKTIRLDFDLKTSQHGL